MVSYEERKENIENSLQFTGLSVDADIRDALPECYNAVADVTVL